MKRKCTYSYALGDNFLSVLIMCTDKKSGELVGRIEFEPRFPLSEKERAKEINHFLKQYGLHLPFRHRFFNQ
jgi:hypothetical protein